MILLKAGAEIDSDEEGFPALIIAASAGNTEAVSLLLQHGADPHKLDVYNEDALIVACTFKRIKVITLLLSGWVDPNKILPEGFTYLMMFAHKDSEMKTKNALNSILLLTAAGANISTKNAAGNTALEMAIEQKNRPVVALLTIIEFTRSKLFEKVIEERIPVKNISEIVFMYLLEDIPTLLQIATYVANELPDNEELQKIKSSINYLEKKLAKKVNIPKPVAVSV